nr:heavy metal response regulator transcription factor [Pararhodobacter sp.]
MKTGDYLRQGLSWRPAMWLTWRAGRPWASPGTGWPRWASPGTGCAPPDRPLDVMLPSLDGWDVLQKLRHGGRETPVLFLTARDEVADRVRGLELGADDYLVKPFAFAEFLARVRTLLRRGRISEPETLRSANLELDLLRRRVIRDGQRIDLTAKEFALLELLLRRQGEVLPRSLIASQVWDMNFDSDTNVIEVAVRRLRAKVDDAFEPKLIRTVRGMGYVLESMEPV